MPYKHGVNINCPSIPTLTWSSSQSDHFFFTTSTTLEYTIPTNLNMATHEQLESTSSRPALDPTTWAHDHPKDAATTAATAKPAEAGSGTTVHIGTRRSALAVMQAELVLKALQKAHPEVNYEVHAMSTMGDKNQVSALHDFGAKSLWTHELEAELLDGKLDLVVHCLKDMPTQLPPKCTLAAILEREDPRDAVVMKASVNYKTLADLPPGAVVGTSSLRRSAQIKRKYPHLQFKDVRGNLGTRLGKLDAEDGDYSCLVLAAAGLIRLGLGQRITQLLDSKTPGGGGILHAVGQGALAIEVRKGDEKTTALLKSLVSLESTLAGTAERALLRRLEGGCSVPIGVETTWVEKGKLLMKSIVVSLDGTECVEAERLEEILTEKDADEFGILLANDLVEKGATRILDAIKEGRPATETGVGGD